jgi:hypothetical protein
MRAALRLDSNRRVLLALVLIAAALFFGSILFIISRAHP